MAGFYPDVPDHRMALDRDGTLLITVSGGVPTTQTNAVLINLNDESSTPQYNWNATYIVVLFPELRDLTYLYTQVTRLFGSPITMTVTTSVDTTNGVDGTWVACTTFSLVQTAINPNYRTDIVAASASGIKAVRFYCYESNGWSNYHALHLYGTITSGENPDRLELWHPTLDERVGAAYFDWGDVGRGSTGDITFRVKNQSATLTADTITVSTDGLAEPTPSVSGAHTLSNGGAYAATTSVASLAPGAISDVLTLRRTLAANAVLSVWTFRVNAVAASWT